MKIRTRLLISFLALSILPFSILGILTLFTFITSLTNLTYSRLEALREVKKFQIHSFFAEKEKNMKVLMETVSSLRQAAFEKLRIVQEIKQADIEEYFGDIFRDIRMISGNTAVYRAMLDFKTVYDESGGLDQDLYGYYETIKYGNFLNQFKKAYGYYDILLISVEGRVLYTANRESDLGKSVLQLPLKNTGLGRVFSDAMKRVSIQDFSVYQPSQDVQIAFVGAPVKDQFENTVGAIVVKIDTQEINSIVERGQDIGGTDDSFLITSQNNTLFYRSNRRTSSGRFGEIYKGQDIFNSPQQTKKRFNPSHSKHPQIIEYCRLSITGLDWLLVTVMDLEEVITPRLNQEADDYFQKFLSIYGYLDLLLITPAGDVFYSVAKSPEYGTNLVTGPHAGTSLGKLFHRVYQSGQFAFEDFQPYPSRDNKPVAFIAQPVIFNDTVELVVALQLSLETINTVMQERSGMGRTGETYLVGPDRLMRSDSYLDPEEYSVQSSFFEPLRKQISSKAAEEALSGNPGRDLIVNYNRDEVLSAYSPVHVWDTTWALIAEIDSREALYPARLTVYFIGITGVLGIILISFFCVLIAGRITSPLKQLTEAIEEISRGQMDVSVSPELTRPLDEVGTLATAFNHMTQRLKAAMQDLKLEITERERTERELSQLQNLLTNIINSMPSVLVGVDIEGRVMQWNQQAEMATGVSAEQAHGGRLDQYYPLLASEMGHIKQAVEHRTVQKSERVSVESGDETNFLDITIYPLVANGTEGAVIRLDDVTDRVKIEEIIIQTEKMMSIGGLAAGMAHEINNPLGIILQGVQNTFRRLSPELKQNKEAADQLGVDLQRVQSYLKDRNIIDYLKAIQEAGTRAAKIVENMLDFSRSSASQKVDLNVNDVVESSLLLAMKDFKLDTQFDFRHILIDKQYGEMLPTISCSKTEIEQVVLNIMKNAAQAMHQKKDPQYQPRLTLSTRQKDRYLEIEIEDNGPGMDDKTRKRIFEPFFTTKPVGIGTGLGLSVSYFIITRNHYGKIDVKSMPGKGSSFKISLPILDHNQQKNELPDQTRGR